MSQKCDWALNSQGEEHYHDTEWGIPVHDERLLFEFLVLEGAQAGLSWSTILNKRENYRLAFDNFEVEKVANYNQDKIDELLNNAGIVRNKLKINAAVTNAQAFIKVQEEYGSFDSYIWQFVKGKTIQNSWKTFAEVPVNTKESDAMSKSLKQKGFKFVGSTICYAHMQATGMVNDHTVNCFRHKELMKMAS